MAGFTSTAARCATCPVRERRVGLVPENDALWPHLTVAENVAYGLKVQGVGTTERRKRTVETLSLTRLDSLAEQRPDTLTPLQRRRGRPGSGAGG